MKNWRCKVALNETVVVSTNYEYCYDEFLCVFI